MVSAEQWKSTCLACNKEVTFAGGFKCKARPGNHRLESRVYYHMGGATLQNERERRSWAPLVILMAHPDQMDEASGRMITVAPLEAQFQPGGVFSTEDAERQFYLETGNRGIGWGEAGRKQWERVYLTQTQRKAITEAELQESERKLAENNALLAQVQKQTKAATGGKQASA